MPTPDLDAIVDAGRKAIAAAADLDELREAEQAHLAKRSALGEVQRSLGGLDEAARRDLGRRVNQARTTLQAELASRRAELEEQRDAALLEAERVDVTLPGRVPPRGAVHPITRTGDELVDIFIGLGYRLADGPGVGLDRLGGPADLQLPVYEVTCRDRYRAATPGPAGPPVDHRLEVLAVDRGLTLGHLLGTLLAVARAGLGERRHVRLVPAHHPATAPTVRLDVRCLACEGRGGDCRSCAGRGWAPLGRAGMLPPETVAAGDPDVAGFTAVIGLAELFMLGSGLADPSALTDNDIRWLAGA
jgi:phenylalanyl-tRNA synthetase alpha chain